MSPSSPARPGGGRGVALELGAAGATVYVTGRSAGGKRSPMDRPETLEETAALVDEAGGAGVLAPTDHTDPAQVRALAERIRREQVGRLDLLVNNVWGGDRSPRGARRSGSTTSTTRSRCSATRSGRT